MPHVNKLEGVPVSSETWVVETQARIDAQQAIVATQLPGSKGHRLAVSVLLLLQDSLFVQSQAMLLLKAARQSTAAWRDGHPPCG